MSRGLIVKPELNFSAIPVWQPRQHFGHSLAGSRMTPGRCDVGQGDQNEGAVLQPWVRQDQTVGGAGRLYVWVQGAPGVLRAIIRRNPLAHGQQVDVDYARAPAAAIALSSHLGLDFVQDLQQCRW